MSGGTIKLLLLLLVSVNCQQENTNQEETIEEYGNRSVKAVLAVTLILAFQTAIFYIGKSIHYRQLLSKKRNITNSLLSKNEDVFSMRDM
jgi:hypothetical protein